MGMNNSDFSRLGPAAQQQVLQKLDKQRTREPSQNKYHAEPVYVTMPDGKSVRFASRKEGDRYQQLWLMQRAGMIKNLQCQKVYELVPHQTREDGKIEQPVVYIADFVYMQRTADTWTCIVEDVKGYTDPKGAAYRLFIVKRKLMLQRYGITVREV